MLFTIENFMGSQTTEKLDTQITQVPPGVEYLVIIPQGKMDTAPFKYKTGEKIGQDGCQVVLYVEILNHPGLKEEMGRVPTIRDAFIIDISADGSALDFGRGKNVRLGQYREAMGQNIPGTPWSPTMMFGVPFVIKAGVEPYKGQNQTTVAGIRAATPADSVTLVGHQVQVA